MSLSTVAAPLRPDEALLKLPASRPERFQRSDFVAAGLVFLITLGVYIATLAPNVTLLDSGELITAAATFGVGHPPGYPLWTMSGFALSHLLPIGNMAWRMNLLCALFGAASNAVLTLLVCHSGRWLLQRWTDAGTQAAVRPYCFYAGLLAGLTIGFSDVMWSQAVISAVHGTLNALFVNLELLFFYLWMLEPRKNHRLILAVFVFSLGLTNHHTLVQMIPAFLLAAGLVRAGKFWSVLFAVGLFSLSTLVYISWLSGDEALHSISQVLTVFMFVGLAVVAFFFLKEFRLHLFLLGAGTAVAIFAYSHYLMGVSESETARYLPSQTSHFWLWGSYVKPGWLQLETWHGAMMLGLTALGLGLLYSSTLDRRLIIGVFAVGWIGLVPYSYERIASSTNPPMNWGFASERGGFYYEVSREQYPKSLPTLIKMTIGKKIGVVPEDAQLDATIGQPDYLPRLGMSFYFYGSNLEQNFTVPLIFMTLAVLLFVRRCDWPQINWFIFLGAAFFCLGFMLQLIAPQESFDFQRNMQYKVFHLQSHCIFVLLMGYGVLAAMTYLHDWLPEVPARFGVVGFGLPALFLSLLPFWSNFDDCSEAGHWFGYDYGADIMRPLEKNAVFLGGSDAGRFIPTYMAFVESQQDPRWKREPNFDRRDVAVITQNALCDTQYTKYIRNQYDDRFRPKPSDYTPFEKWLGRDRAYPQEQVICMSDKELSDCWNEYRSWPEVEARIEQYGPGAEIRPGYNDVFEINGIVAKKIFEKNKQNHTFYLEQSVPIPWMDPYLLPSGLVLQLNPEPMTDAEFAAKARIDEDYTFWDAYSDRLLRNPLFRIDDTATLNFSKLAYWHADLYRFRHLDKEEEHWLRISLALCPQMPDAVMELTQLLAREKRFDEALAVAQLAHDRDSFNDLFATRIEWVKAVKMFGSEEEDLRAKLAKSPYDVDLNLDFASLLQDESKFDELNQRLRIAAGLTNWSREAMSGVVQYYVDKVHNPEAAIAFLEARAEIDPKASEVIYNLAALHAKLDHADQAIHYLSQAIDVGGTNALNSARIDPRFALLQDDPRFQDLISGRSATNAPVVTPSTNAPLPVVPTAKPVKN